MDSLANWVIYSSELYKLLPLFSVSVKCEMRYTFLWGLKSAPFYLSSRLFYPFFSVYNVTEAAGNVSKVRDDKMRAAGI